MVFYTDQKGNVYEASEPRGLYIDMKKGDIIIKNAHSRGRITSREMQANPYLYTYIKKDGAFKYIYTKVWAGDPK